MLCSWNEILILVNFSLNSWDLQLISDNSRDIHFQSLETFSSCWRLWWTMYGFNEALLPIQLCRIFFKWCYREFIKLDLLNICSIFRQKAQVLTIPAVLQTPICFKSKNQVIAVFVATYDLTIDKCWYLVKFNKFWRKKVSFCTAHSLWKVQTG